MKLTSMLLLLFIANVVIAQQQKIEGNGKIVEFAATYNKIKVLINKSSYDEVGELSINDDIKINDHKGC